MTQSSSTLVQFRAPTATPLPRPANDLLVLQGIKAGYGASQVLFGINLALQPGECITLLGRNGMGKSTTIKTILGMIAPSGGEIEFRGARVTGWRSHKIAQMGIGLVPEGRHVFPNLTVYENLIATASQRNASALPWTLNRVYDLFPRLRERSGNLGSALSGGEQQMLAIGRALMTNPHLLILDEATEGIAPIIRAEIWNCLDVIKKTGVALIVVDKNIGPLLRLADRHYILEKGCVVWSGSSGKLRSQPNLLHDYVGV